MPLRAKVINPSFRTTASMSSVAEIPKELPGDDPDDVLFHSHYGVRLIELNRPKKLNSLNGSMVRKIVPRLQEWEKSDLANVIMLSGTGSKALCAGGDVAALALQNEKGIEGQQASTNFFAEEYRLDHLIATYQKPFISVMDGITMGGGVGLSVHAPFRIATERTVFAMPETTIGFFPDVGASFFLPRLDGEVGTYLALTSERLSGVQALYAGVATHYLHSSALQNLTARLSELVFRDDAKPEERMILVNKTMAEFSTGVPSLREEPMWLSGQVRSAIDRCFQYNSVEEIIQALEQETEMTKWAQRTLETLSVRSPTSLKVALRQMRVGKQWNIAETFHREHMLASKFMRHPDFVEGVKARLMSKPPRQATWQPATLQEVTNEAVDDFFTIPDNESRIALYHNDEQRNYTESPYHFGLPTEEDIEQIVRRHASTEELKLNDIVARYQGKEGVKEKVADILARRTVRTAKGLRWE
ncbi:putative mitochondrial 3-hydroxyisobutyryl-CoA hydrolase [Aspergillus sclerotioniger CBS 115572]|uniref:3-hydroxyisobutyryl-CoA hydrolase n=1 Tax=Aspergillus sclerotioniger CBS 115572 TaxID=1450535 RepID=A0A317X6T9_9EURO|nr:putative mitochondrial 3-hydroxyisobutyryl-CoA hydrolase [Aspergillus sclerotioniger CBS 115572]PWY94283.1 putative mitochondrial 3-hydroxyisobutyryl-CoA hydrolase [Aspergillus sclerotioniger CBS 115572]